MRIDDGSGLVFGDFDEADCFHIEKCPIYSTLSGKGYNTVEFVLRRPRNELLFVEGKSTLPRATNVEEFNQQIATISQKFMDSLHLALGIWFGEHNAKAVVPSGRDEFFTYGAQIVFVLVVKELWGKANSIAEMVRQKLRREHTLIRFKVLVLREQDAAKQNLTVREIET